MQEQASLPVRMVRQRQYLVEGMLGSCSCRATYLVREQRARDVPGNLFVLKEVLEPNKQARHRLVSAGKFLRRLHHPGLPRVHRVFNDDKNKRVYLLVDYIAGQDLETLRQQQPENLFAWTEAMHIMAPINSALTYLHHQRPPIIHGDIKPANILRAREDSRVVLVDFGMIKAYDPGSPTAADRYCYRAPEQCNGSIDVRTDIYALGATFYTLTTGKLPPDATSRLTQVSNKAMDPLEPVNSIVPGIPMHIGKAIERAMSLDAQHRFSSVEEFCEALWLVLADHPAPVFGLPSVPQDPPTVPASGLGQAVGRTIENLVPEPQLVALVPDSIEEQEDLDPEQTPVVAVPESIEGREDQDLEQQPPVVPAHTREQDHLDGLPVLESVEEQEDLDIAMLPPIVPVPESVEEREEPDATVRLPKLPPVIPVPESVEEREEPDATVRLPKLPPVVPVPESVEEQEDLDLEPPLPKPPAGVKEQEGLYVVKLLPKLLGDVMAPISLRKQGVLLIILILLINLGIGASFLSRVPSHLAAYSATPTSHAASPAFTPTSAPVASSYSTLAALYNGTIYDVAANVTTKMSLTGIQQTEITIGGNFTGLHRTGTFNGIIDPPKHLQFTVKDSAGHLILTFDGHMQSDGELSGSYCSVDQDARCTSEYGIWSVAPVP
jgi:serine/threonine protein kinase